MSDFLDICRREATCLLLAVYGAMAWPRTALAFDPMPDGFRDEVLAIGRRHYPNAVPPLNAGPGTDDLIWGDHHLYLYNLYRGVRELPPVPREMEILAWLERFNPESQAKMEAARKATDDWNTAKPLLRPKFQPQAFASSYKRLVQQPFSPGLAIVYAFDLARSPTRSAAKSSRSMRRASGLLAPMADRRPIASLLSQARRRRQASSRFPFHAPISMTASRVFEAASAVCLRTGSLGAPSWF